MATVHPSSEVSPEATLGSDVEIGPGCRVEGRVTLGQGVKLYGNNWLQGPLDIGANTVLYPFSCVGFEAQHAKFKKGDPTAGVKIGADCILREHTTVHAALDDEHGPTTIGDSVFMMVGSHVGHDVQMGNRCILVNNAAIGGHAIIGEGVNFGGQSAVHQFTRIGRFSMISGGVAVSMDIPPFCVAPERNRINGVNLIGLRRNGFTRRDIELVRKAFRKAFHVVLQRAEQVEVLEPMAAESPAVAEMLEFVKSAERPICPGPMRAPRVSAHWFRSVLKGETEFAIEDAEGDS
ncbi:MAG: acyl-ACP--UDP-N-acetylglucosamine O-acyltransferase [Planctomycetota bacterium]